MQFCASLAAFSWHASFLGTKMIALPCLLQPAVWKYRKESFTCGLGLFSSFPPPDFPYIPIWFRPTWRMHHWHSKLWSADDIAADVQVLSKVNSSHSKLAISYIYNVTLLGLLMAIPVLMTSASDLCLMPEWLLQILDLAQHQSLKLLLYTSDFPEVCLVILLGNPLKSVRITDLLSRLGRAIQQTPR